MLKVLEFTIHLFWNEKNVEHSIFFIKPTLPLQKKLWSCWKSLNFSGQLTFSRFYCIFGRLAINTFFIQIESFCKTLLRKTATIFEIKTFKFWGFLGLNSCENWTEKNYFWVRLGHPSNMSCKEVGAIYGILLINSFHATN